MDIKAQDVRRSLLSCPEWNSNQKIHCFSSSKCSLFDIEVTVLGIYGQFTLPIKLVQKVKYEGWNFNSGNYLFTTDTK